MGCLEGSGAVRHIYIYVVKQLKVNIKLLIGGKTRKEFNSETHLVFVGYVKAFDRVRRYTLFEIKQRDILPIY